MKEILIGFDCNICLHSLAPSLAVFPVLSALLALVHIAISRTVLFFFLTKELPAGVVDHSPSSRHKGQRTIYTTLLLFLILFQP